MNNTKDAFKNGKKINDYLLERKWRKGYSKERCFNSYRLENEKEVLCEVKIPLDNNNQSYEKEFKENIGILADYYEINYYEMIKRLDINIDVDIEDILEILNTLDGFNTLKWNRLNLYKRNKLIKVDQLNVYKKTGMSNSNIIEYVYNRSKEL